mmetsp:Transcript_14351/g.35785  ORF Transcript_14351/g.35785 Transcript_14351/m.35785 type:complete len:80 (-) Transcript_14351:424-663(-)|eukprot:CAMPEP_0178993554 /NCGR_PEP_ID=MMETSP0795-20121207/6767_1 /TAXON_ID=88552 /ORGANISM="Amoebophrya sp., Strain Ameob2" /LENGTH=79 /DNA_ID=CAMNT_0020685625 /DNA_START=158 /DNA_END=397 /DNA_ORIENTATION=+
MTDPAISVPDDQHQDLTLFVQNLLKEMQTRFQTMSDGIINRIDDMGGRIDELERSINTLMNEAMVDEEAAKAPTNITNQ